MRTAGSWDCRISTVTHERRASKIPSWSGSEKNFLYEQTGIQLMEMNTLYQLLAEPPERLAQASNLLFIPDLINYWLTGIVSTERTFASTSQLYDVRKRDWAYPMLDAVGTAVPHAWGHTGRRRSRWDLFYPKSRKRRARVVWKLCFRGLTIRLRRWPRCLRAKGRGRF